jgi:aspartate aminotransferase
MLDEEALGGICDLVLEENARRGAGERPLFLLWDQVYATLTFGRAHLHPVALRPAMAPFTITIDGISKAMAATGVRVGWATGPAAVIGPMSDVLGHVGAWAPRAEQVATAAFLADVPAEREARAALVRGVRERLTLLHDGIASLAADGHPVQALEPAGAIYLTARVAVAGRTMGDGTMLRTGDDVRRWLLAEAGLAVVPFSAFGDDRDDGWFRLSIGAVSPPAIREMLPRLRAALETLGP